MNVTNEISRRASLVLPQMIASCRALGMSSSAFTS